MITSFKLQEEREGMLRVFGEAVVSTGRVMFRSSGEKEEEEAQSGKMRLGSLVAWVCLLGAT